ncbi:hypothetical protein [Sphaerotilus sp.]|uniref:hypothetical protein n=1 Tax=Sphaerotilus sp. TaxID=2093942 RepID=UPI00286DF593|nr:hypothetical protein [Sphaerotilus sp.]
MKTGKYSVVIGNVPPTSNIGEGSVVIGATDSNGNTILNTHMAVGYGAKAGPGSIAIGAFAGSGLPEFSFPPQLQPEMEDIIQLVVRSENQALVDALANVAAELRPQSPDRGVVLAAWEGVKSLATVDGAYNLLSRASTALLAYLAQSGA